MIADAVRDSVTINLEGENAMGSKDKKKESKGKKPQPKPLASCR